MGVDVTLRTQLAENVIAQLQEAILGSEALVRGSLAERRDDPYSDIDVLWDVPDRDFTAAVAELPAILAKVHPLASLRFDLDFQRSAKRRLAFVRFAGVPLFWRVDLDMFAASVGRDPDYDRNNPAARGTDWSLTESALMNAIAAVRAHRRGRDNEAVRLLERAENRVGVTPTPSDCECASFGSSRRSLTKTRHKGRSRSRSRGSSRSPSPSDPALFQLQRPEPFGDTRQIGTLRSGQALCSSHLVTHLVRAWLSLVGRIAGRHRREQNAAPTRTAGGGA